MPGFFEALNNHAPKKETVHTVTIQGQNVVVTLEKKLEVMRHGEDAYMWKDPSTFVLKPRPKVGIQYRQLLKADKGFKFHDGDPYYPVGIEEGGHTWQQESE